MAAFPERTVAVDAGELAALRKRLARALEDVESAQEAGALHYDNAVYWQRRARAAEACLAAQGAQRHPASSP
jgi:hypothetical protein